MEKKRWKEKNSIRKTKKKEGQTSLMNLFNLLDGL